MRRKENRWGKGALAQGKRWSYYRRRYHYNKEEGKKREKKEGNCFCNRGKRGDGFDLEKMGHK